MANVNIANGAAAKPPDSIIRGYQLEEMIGHGTFSEVYRAVHMETGEVLALKCFRQQMQTKEHYHIAAKEIALMKILDHPNIIPLKVFEVNSRFVFLGTEFAPNGSLRDYMTATGNVPEPNIQFIMKQLLSALDYMHSLGIFHGDLKPHNILCMNMLDEGPVLKICDFGLAEIKLTGYDLSYRAGSFLFMAPEVLLKYPVDVRCDLWSAGVLMYFMMFSRTLFGFNDKQRDKHFNSIQKRVSPNYEGSEKYSLTCNDLLKCLLSYDKQLRPTGEFLRKHPFLNIEEQPLNPGDMFIKNARQHISKSFISDQNKHHGDALIEAMQGIIELKIHYNLSNNKQVQNYLFSKWLQYEEFVHSQERVLVLCPSSEELINDTEFRKHLQSTPKLLDGFDIGCSAEMFLVEGNYQKALSLFHQALRMMLPLMKNEPKSNRKEILGKRLKKWIENVEALTNRVSDESDEEDFLTTALAIAKNGKGKE